MPTNYGLIDLRQILPFTPTNNSAPFVAKACVAKADPSSCLAYYFADDQGLWLHVPSDELDEEMFEAITGFADHERTGKFMGNYLVYGLADGGPLLPLPFTAAQLVELDRRTGGVFSEHLECGTDTDSRITHLTQLSSKAAELACALAYGEMPDWVEPVAELAREVDTQDAAPLQRIAEQEYGRPRKAKAEKRRYWRDVVLNHIIERMQAGQFASAVELYHALFAMAGDNSPFDKGIDRHRGSLFVREIAKPLSLKTVQNAWSDLKRTAAQK